MSKTILATMMLLGICVNAHAQQKCPVSELTNYVATPPILTKNDRTGMSAASQDLQCSPGSQSTCPDHYVIESGCGKIKCVGNACARVCTTFTNVSNDNIPFSPDGSTQLMITGSGLTFPTGRGKPARTTLGLPPIYNCAINSQWYIANPNNRGPGAACHFIVDGQDIQIADSSFYRSEPFVRPDNWGNVCDGTNGVKCQFSQNGPQLCDSDSIYSYDCGDGTSEPLRLLSAIVVSTCTIE